MKIVPKSEEAIIAGTGQEIAGRSGPTPNLIPWKPGDRVMPMKLVKTGHRSGGVVALVAGLAWTYYFADILLEEIKTSGLDAGQSFLFLVVLGGIVVFLCGLSQFIYLEETIVYPEMVSWRRHGLTGYKAWQEPVSRYNGVLREHQYHDPEHGPSYMEYSVVLSHAESSKRVTLYEAHDSLLSPLPEWEQQWIRYAELFRIPLLEETGEGIVASSPKDLPAPLIDKIRSGGIDLSRIDPLAVRPGGGISVERQDDLWVVTLKPLARLCGGVVGIGLGAALLGSASYFGMLPFGPFLTAAIALAVVALFFAVHISRRLNHPEQIAVGRTEIWYRSWTAKRGWDTRSMAVRDILDISVKRDAADPRKGEQIVVRGMKDAMRFGDWLPSEKRRQVKSVLVSLIGRDGK